MTRKRRTLTPEEVDAIDPQFIDSVTGDRLIATYRQLREMFKTTAEMHEDLLTQLVALWLAKQQGDAEEAVEWMTEAVDDWLDDDTISDEWAHDWKLWLAAHGSYTKGKRCNICALPVSTYSSDWSACSERHAKAIQGRLKDEQCRICNTVTACAYESAGSPICADCWPGERLLAERRAAWAARFNTEAAGATGSTAP